MLNSLRVAVLAFGLVAASVSAQPQAPSFGVDGLSTDVVNVWDMQPSSPGVGWGGSELANGHRYVTSLGGLLSGVDVPQGARILSMELEACDDSATGEVTALLFRSPRVGDSVPLALLATGDPQTPGCDGFFVDLTSPETVDIAANRYTVIVSNKTFDGTTTIGSVRILYKLQVSPPPSVTTFNDVPPTDPAFQFIEALATSGITSGCGGGNYCPDATLTRRQMAVFLAKALGLYWPVSYVTPAP